MRLVFMAALLTACSTVPLEPGDPNAQRLADLEERVERLSLELSEVRAQLAVPGEAVERRTRRHTERRRSVVAASEIDALLSDAEQLSKLGRALLHRDRDGGYDGYRLSAIHEGSLMDRLGLHNGDVLHEVSGLPLTSIEGAMEAYQSLQDAEELTLELTRRGEPVQLVIEVVPTP